MNNEIVGLLSSEVEREIEHLQSLQPGDKEHTEVVDTLVKLHKLKIEEQKTIFESTDKKESLEFERKIKGDELTLKKQQFELDKETQTKDFQLKDNLEKDSKVDRYVKVGVEVAGIVLPLVAYGMWYNRGLKFEETGTFTSSMIKNLLGKFKPTKR